MTRRCTPLPALAVNLILLTTALSAQTGARAGSDERLIATFLAKLRRGVATHDIATVASVIEFPLMINAGLTVPIRDEAVLKSLYDAFFTPELRYAIWCAPVERGATRLTIAKQLIAERKGAAFKIIGMKGTPVPPKPRQPRKPQRVIFPTYHRLAPFAGTLGPDGVDSYVIWVRKGEVLRATLSGFKGHSASMKILNERGQPVDAKAGDIPRTWAAPVPDTGDYRIDIVRRTDFCEPPLSTTSPSRFHKARACVATRHLNRVARTWDHHTNRAT